MEGESLISKMNRKMLQEMDDYFLSCFDITLFIHKVISNPPEVFTLDMLPNNAFRIFKNSKIENQIMKACDNSVASQFYNSNSMYFFENKLHRTNGPALIVNNSKLYYIKGILYKDVKHWLDALTAEQRQNFIWNLDSI